MATKVRVTVSGSGSEIVHCEVSGGSSGEYGSGSHDFEIGQVQSMVCFLTVKRLAEGKVKILPVTGDVNIEIDSGKAKRVKKGGGVSLSKKQNRAVIHEKP